MEQARKIEQALIMMMRDKGSNVIARGAGGRPTAIVDDAGKQIDEIPPAPQMATQLRESRQQAQDVQGPDPLAQTASDWQQDTAGMVPPGSPPITRTGNLGDPSRLPADPVKFDQPAPSMSRDLDTFPDRETYYGRPPDEIAPADLKRHRQDLEAEEAGIRQAEIDAHGELDPQSALSKQEMIDSMEAEFADLQQDFQRLAGRPPTPDEMKDIGTLEHLIDILKEASGEVPTPRASNLNPLDDDIPF